MKGKVPWSIPSPLPLHLHYTIHAILALPPPLSDHPPPLQFIGEQFIFVIKLYRRETNIVAGQGVQLNTDKMAALGAVPWLEIAFETLLKSNFTPSAGHCTFASCLT